jgi:glycosyltransferase involved in cell wall biosynthesis
MKIAFCTDGIFPHAVGGMQRHSRLLIEELIKEGADVYVFHPHEEVIFPTAKEVRIQGIDTAKNYLKECKTYSKRMYLALKQENFDVIYSQGLSVWYKAEEFSDKLVVNPHGLEPFQAIGFKDKLIAIPFKRVFSSIFKKSRAVVSLGGRLTPIIKKIVGNDKIWVLPNAINLPEKQKTSFPEKGEKLEVFFLARFANNKGIHILMEAISQLNKEGFEDKFHFKLGGKGPMWEHYKSGTKSYKNVELLGFVDDEDIPDLYTSSDIFCLPTLFEGMPTVVLEAMGYGIPIIVSDVGATAEQVDTSNGYLINKNNVDELKMALKDYLELSADKKKSMGLTSFERVKNNFTWSAVAKRHLEKFAEIQSK